MVKRINGKVAYQDFSGGFYGIIADNGTEYRPVNMPEQLKKNGASVSLVVTKAKEEVSMFMWGEAVRIISFHTLMP